MQLRYTVYDTHNRTWLKEIQQPAGVEDAICTNWTRDPEEALKFPGAKSARQIVEVLGEKGFEIRNARGAAI